MRLLAQGLRSKDISARLNVKPNTVASIVERICVSLDTKTMAQAMAVWAVADYIEANEEDE
jgi:DNA-binding NarL/FixJ family response regulator